MEFEEFQRRFAGRVREIRMKKGLSQETVSGAHMSARTVQRIEAGEEAPRLETIFRLAEGLGVKPAELFKF